MILKTAFIKLNDTSINEIKVTSKSEMEADGVYCCYVLEGSVNAVDPVLEDADKEELLRREIVLYEGTETPGATFMYYWREANKLYLNQAHALRLYNTDLQSSSNKHMGVLFLVPLEFAGGASESAVSFRSSSGKDILLNYQYDKAHLHCGALVHNGDSSEFDKHDKNVTFIRENPTNAVSESTARITPVTKGKNFATNGKFYCGKTVSFFNCKEYYQDRYSYVKSNIFGPDNRISALKNTGNTSVYYIAGGLSLTNLPTGDVKDCVAKGVDGGGIAYAKGKFIQMQNTISSELSTPANYDFTYTDDIQYVPYDPTNIDMFDINTLSPSNAVQINVHVDHKGQLFDAGNGARFRLIDTQAAKITCSLTVYKSHNFKQEHEAIWDTKPDTNDRLFRFPKGTEFIVSVNGIKDDGSIFLRWTKLDASKYECLATNLGGCRATDKYSNIISDCNFSLYDYYSDVYTEISKGLTSNSRYSIVIPKLKIFDDINMNAFIATLNGSNTTQIPLTSQSTLNSLSLPSISKNEYLTIGTLESKVYVINSGNRREYEYSLKNKGGNAVKIEFSDSKASYIDATTLGDMGDRPYLATKGNTGDNESFMQWFMAAYPRNTPKTP